MSGVFVEGFVETLSRVSCLYVLMPETYVVRDAPRDREPSRSLVSFDRPGSCVHSDSLH